MDARFRGHDGSLGSAVTLFRNCYHPPPPPPPPPPPDDPPPPLPDDEPGAVDEDEMALLSDEPRPLEMFDRSLMPLDPWYHAIAPTAAAAAAGPTAAAKRSAQVFSTPSASAYGRNFWNSST